MVPNIVKLILIWDAELECRKRQSLNAQPTWIKLYIFPTLEFTLLEKTSFFHQRLSDTRIYVTLKTPLSVDNECKCQLLSLIYPYTTPFIPQQLSHPRFYPLIRILPSHPRFTLSSAFYPLIRVLHSHPPVRVLPSHPTVRPSVRHPPIRIRVLPSTCFTFATLLSIWRLYFPGVLRVHNCALIMISA